MLWKAQKDRGHRTMILTNSKEATINHIKNHPLLYTKKGYANQYWLKGYSFVNPILYTGTNAVYFGTLMVKKTGEFDVNINWKRRSSSALPPNIYYEYAYPELIDLLIDKFLEIYKNAQEASKIEEIEGDFE